MNEHELFVEVRQGARCSYRPLTADEHQLVISRMHAIATQRQIIKDAKAALDVMVKACQDDALLSMVFYDVPGFPYDARTFLLANRVDLI